MHVLGPVSSVSEGIGWSSPYSAEVLCVLIQVCRFGQLADILALSSIVYTCIHMTCRSLYQTSPSEVWLVAIHAAFRWALGLCCFNRIKGWSRVECNYYSC